MRDSLETLTACCERMPSSAGSCGRQACRRADEKSRLVEARASIQPGKSRISVVYVYLYRSKRLTQVGVGDL